MGKDTHLQVLKSGESNFADVTSSNIKNGAFGIIFQAKNGDIYAMGNGTHLQVLKSGESNFADVTSSNITDGTGGTIFQAKNGDIYAMGNGTHLQVLKSGESNFTDVTSSNIKNGSFGTIFQAKNGDIYAMGNGTRLQVLKSGEINFVDVTSSNITDGTGGSIFQTKNGDIYATGYKTGLERLENNLLEFIKTDETIKSANDGTIIVSNSKNKYSSLQYKLKSSSNWKDVPVNGKITGLNSGTYQFQWVGKNGEQYEGTNDLMIAITEQIIIRTKIIAPTKTPIFTKIDATGKNKNDGSITVVNGIDSYSQLQYKLKSSSNWKDVPTNGKITGLTPGTYQFQWKSKNDEQYLNTTTTIRSIKNEIMLSVQKSFSKNSDNETVILSTTIPIGLIIIVVTLLLIKYKFFKK